MKLESDLFIVKLEYELQRTHSELAIIQKYIDSMPMPVWIKKKPFEGAPVMVLINEAYEQRYGISKEAYKGRTDREVWPLDIAEGFQKADEEVLRRKTAVKTLEEVIINGQRKTETFWKFYLELPKGEQGIGGLISC